MESPLPHQKVFRRVCGAKHSLGWNWNGATTCLPPKTSWQKVRLVSMSTFEHQLTHAIYTVGDMCPSVTHIFVLSPQCVGSEHDFGFVTSLRDQVCVCAQVISAGVFQNLRQVNSWCSIDTSIHLVCICTQHGDTCSHVLIIYPICICEVM